MIALGKYPSEKLFLANDLFIHSSRKLYEELKGVETIEIFGMSPYGDDSLLNRINMMSYVVVYVYDKDNNPETEEWESVLKCPHIINNSLEISQ